MTEAPPHDAPVGEAPEPYVSLGTGYLKLWSASAISNVGDGIDAAALPLLAAALTRDPLVFSTVAVAQRLPWLLFALQAGALADRWDRLRIMSVSNVVRFLLMGGLGVAVLADTASFPMLVGVSFLLGVAEVMFDNAAQAVLPALVPRAQLERANGRLFAAETVANQFAGPPLGGFLFGVAASLPILVDAGTFLISAALIATITRHVSRPARAAETTAARPPMRLQIRDGLRWLWQHRLLRTLALLLGLMNGLTAMGWAIVALLALDELGVSEFGFGILLTSSAIGSVLASTLAGRAVTHLGRGPVLIMGLIGSGATCLLIGGAPNVWVLGAGFALFSVFAVLWNVVTVSLRQTIIPDELLGRVNSVYRFLGWGSIPVGSFLGGLLSSGLGLRAPWLVSGAGILVATVAALPVVNTRTIEAARAGAD